MTLKKAQKYALRAQAHHLKPVILMGAHGLTSAVLQEIDIALKAHELIKIKLAGIEAEEKEQTIETICDSMQAELIQQIGHTITIYRKNLD